MPIRADNAVPTEGVLVGELRHAHIVILAQYLAIAQITILLMNSEYMWAGFSYIHFALMVVN